MIIYSRSILLTQPTASTVEELRRASRSVDTAHQDLGDPLRYHLVEA
jgi:hypothetical protein